MVLAFYQPTKRRKDARKRTNWERYDWTKGQNSTADKGNILPDELVLAQNIDPMARGGFTKRCGSTLVYDLGADPITRLFTHQGADYICQGTKMTKKAATDVVIKSDFTNTNFCFAEDGNALYMVNGSDAFCKLENDTIANIAADSGDVFITDSSIKKCTQIIRRSARFFATGNPDSPQEIYISEPLAPNKWLYSVKAKYPVVGLGEFHRSVIGLQKELIQAVSGWDPQTDMQVSDVATLGGIYAPRTIKRTGNYLSYLGNAGYYVLSGLDDYNIGTINVAKNIVPDLIKLTDLNKAVSVFHEGKLFLACCNDGTGINNIVWVGHTMLAYINEYGELQWPWTQYKGIKVSDWLIKDKDLYFASATDGKVFKFDPTKWNDNGVPVSMKVVSKEDNLGKHFIFKEFLDLYVAARQYLAIVSTCKLTVRIDRVKQSFKMDFNESVVSGTTILGSGAILGWLDNVEQEVTLFKKKNGSRIEFIFENDKDEPCTIYGIGGALRIKKMKGTKYGVEEV